MLDPILTELRQIREAFSDKYHGDVTAMLAALRASGEASGRKTVTLTPRLYSLPSEQTQSGEAPTKPVVLPPQRRIHSGPDIVCEEIVEQSTS